MQQIYKRHLLHIQNTFSKENLWVAFPILFSWLIIKSSYAYIYVYQGGKKY